MEKSLKIIQVVSKIAKILSIIVFIACIVGVAGSLITLLVFGSINFEEIVLDNGVTLKAFIESEANVDTDAFIPLMISAIITLIATGVVSKFTQIYLEHELKDGTPFTFKGAKECLRLGILGTAISLGASIICGIIGACFKSTTEIDIEFSLDVGFGLFFLFLSAVFYYGATILEKNAQLDKELALKKIAEEKTEENNENEQVDK